MLMDEAFPVPEGDPSLGAYTDGWEQVRQSWPFQDPALPDIDLPMVPNNHDDRSGNKLLHGYWSTYPTYCLIAWPIPETTKNVVRLTTLKMVLAACHLILCDSIQSQGKHYQSRLRSSFQIFREASNGQHDEVISLLPERTDSLEDYARAVDALPKRLITDDAYRPIQLCLNGALTNSGGYARHANRSTSREIVGRTEHAVQEADVEGHLYRHTERTNDSNIITQLRLAAEESGSGPTFFQPRGSIDTERGESSFEAVRNAKGKKASITRLNQLLPFAWERLSLFDLRDLFNYATDLTRNFDGIGASELRAFVSLMFWTGRFPEEVRTLRVVRDFACLPSSTIREHGYLVKDPLVAVMPRYHADGAREVADKWRAYVHQSADRVFLPLPQAAQRHIAEWLDERTPTGTRGMQLFKNKETHYEAAVTDFLERLRKKTSARVTLKRLARQMPMTVSAQCGDRIAAATAMATPVAGLTLAGAYYYSASQQELARTVWQSVEPLSAYLLGATQYAAMPPLPAGAKRARVGSNVCPDDGLSTSMNGGFYKLYVNDLRKVLKYVRTRRHKPEFTVTFHNHYTCYCISMLAAATGYRAVKDPLKSLHVLDAATGWFAISDKDFTDLRNARLMWAPDLLIRQLQAYAAYREIVVNALMLDTNKFGFFFFLHEQNRGNAVTPGAMAQHIYWTYRLPLNANRHFLRTRLAGKGVPGEFIDAFMGHWDTGEEPYGPYSAISPPDFRGEIAPAIEALLKEQGWDVQHAVAPELAQTAIKSLSAATALQEKPPDRLATNAREKRKDDSDRLKMLVNQARLGIEGQGPISIDQEAIDQLFAAVKSDTTISDWRHAHNSLVRQIEDGKISIEEHVGIPRPIVVLNQPIAPFTPNAFHTLSAFRDIEQAFNDSLHNLHPGSSDINEIVGKYLEPSIRLRWKLGLPTLLFGQILFSAATYGGLLSKQALEALMKVLATGGMAIRGQLVFDLEVDGHTRRWYADPLSCVLILRLRFLSERQHMLIAPRDPAQTLRVFIRALAGSQHELEKLPTFLQAAGTAWRLNKPAFLYRWADKDTSSVSWDITCEIRVRFGRQLLRHGQKSAPICDMDNETPMFHAGHDNQLIDENGKEQQRDFRAAYLEFRKCLYKADSRSSWRGQISSQIEQWLDVNRPSIGLIPFLFAKWVQSIAVGKNRGHAGIGSESSLRTYVSRVGREIFVASRDFPDADFDDLDSWRQLYRSVVDKKHGVRARNTSANECQNFHNYVISRIDVLPLSVGEAVGIGATSSTASVDANYVSPAELHRSTEWLAKRAETDKQMEIALHALVLAYWGGLRIGELAALRLRDVQIVYGNSPNPVRIEILAQSHSRHRLKFDTSRRRIPLWCLMPRQQLSSFVAFYHYRREQCADLYNDADAFLFSAFGAGKLPPSENSIRGPVTRVLREVTGDSSLVFHHLRHSAANNWFLALLAQSDDDPIWDLFHEAPAPLQEVSRRINRGLMINPKRRRGILYAVSGLLGHSDPRTTLQSYIHTLSWISATHPDFTCENRQYVGLSRSVLLDSSLLIKSDSAIRSWRARHGKVAIHDLADDWLKRIGSSIQPRAYELTQPPVPIGKLNIEPLRPPIPEYRTMYRIALRIRSLELRHRARLTPLQIKHIADASSQPVWLLDNLYLYMRRWGHMPSGRKVAICRMRYHNRYKTRRKKHLRGHGATINLHQNPELTGLMPAMPRRKQDVEDCQLIWNRLERLLLNTGQWDTVITGHSDLSSVKDRDILSKGLRTFLERSTSSEHILKFFHADPQAARDYVALSLEVFPHNRILVEISRPPGMSEFKARAGSKKELALRDAHCRITPEPTARAYEGWPYGLPAIRLLSMPYDKTRKIPTTSYGAWFGLYSFALLYAAICRAETDAIHSAPDDSSERGNE